MKGQKRISICYLDPKNKKYYVCDADGKYDCGLLQKYCNIALRSGDKAVADMAVELKHLLKCRWSRKGGVPIPLSPSRRNPENIKVYRFSELLKEKQKVIRDRWINERVRFETATCKAPNPDWHEPNTPWFDNERYYEEHKRAVEISVDRDLNNSRFTNHGDFLGTIGKGGTLERNPIRHSRSRIKTITSIGNRYRSRKNPEPIGDVWQLESDEMSAYSDMLSSIVQSAIDGDRKEQRFLVELWDESWGSVKEKLETEGSAWYVWWTDGVREFARRRIHRVNPEPIGDVWQLESDEMSAYSDILSSIAQSAIDGDKKGQRFLVELWDEDWNNIKEKLKTEGSVWYVWWTDGVREFARREMTRR